MKKIDYFALTSASVSRNLALNHQKEIENRCEEDLKREIEKYKATQLITIKK